MTISNNKAGVHPSNKSINFHYFLIEIADARAGHIGCYIVEQAISGRPSDAKLDALWNQVNAQCRQNEARSGLEYRVAATGDRAYCIKYARTKGWRDV